MRYEFDFQMDEKTLTDFYFGHNMRGISGFLWPMIGIFAIVLAVISGDTASPAYRLIYLGFGLIFLFYIPWDLKRKARKQIKTNPYYAQPIHYVLDEEGITTTQGDKEATVAWSNFRKIKITRKSLFLYMRNNNACVFSQEVFGKDWDKAYEWIKSKVGQK